MRFGFEMEAQLESWRMEVFFTKSRGLSQALHLSIEVFRRMFPSVESFFSLPPGHAFAGAATPPVAARPSAWEGDVGGCLGRKTQVISLIAFSAPKAGQLSALFFRRAVRVRSLAHICVD